MNISFLIALILVVVSTVFSCTDIKGQKNLDLEKYMGLSWNLVGRVSKTENTTNPVAKCIYESYSPTEIENPLVYYTSWNGVIDGTKVEDKAVVTIDQTDKSLWNFYFDRTVFRSIIIATNYEWTIDYFCEEQVGLEVFSIRSTNKIVQPEVLDTLKTVLGSYGVDISKFFEVDQTNC